MFWVKVSYREYVAVSPPSPIFEIQWKTLQNQWKNSFFNENQYKTNEKPTFSWTIMVFHCFCNVFDAFHWKQCLCITFIYHTGYCTNGTHERILYKWLQRKDSALILRQICVLICIEIDTEMDLELQSAFWTDLLMNLY